MVLQPGVQAPVQRGQSVGSAVQRIELVCEFVDHDVERRIAAVRLAAVRVPGRRSLGEGVPGNDDGPGVPGFACRGLLVFVHQSGLVLDAPPRHVLGRVNDDSAPAPIPVDPELQDRKASLRGNRDLDSARQLKTAGAGHHLGRQQPPGQFAQRRVGRGAEAPQKRKV